MNTLNEMLERMRQNQPTDEEEVTVMQEVIRNLPFEDMRRMVRSEIFTTWLKANQPFLITIARKRYPDFYLGGT